MMNYLTTDGLTLVEGSLNAAENILRVTPDP